VKTARSKAMKTVACDHRARVVVAGAAVTTPASRTALNGAPLLLPAED
jgi:hypothetical protein